MEVTRRRKCEPKVTWGADLGGGQIERMGGQMSGGGEEGRPPTNGAGNGAGGLATVQPCGWCGGAACGFAGRRMASRMASRMGRRMASSQLVTQCRLKS